MISIKQCFIAMFKRIETKVNTNNSIKTNDRKLTLNDVLDNYTDKSYDYRINIPISVVIPVFNGYELFKDNITSVINNTESMHKIIVIDDNSTDERVRKLLERINEYKNINIISNEKNLGFVKSVNKAMKEVETEYAILLNSDTIVPKGWVDKMIYPYSIYNNVATTTPFSNSSVIYSFPEPFKDNEMKFDINTINESASKILANNKIDSTYSGSGFCMSINMKVWEKIGPLDEQAFDKGYGEENDWCFRATEAGYIHKLVPNLLVQHKHGGSFDSTERKIMSKEHQKILKDRYPYIMNEIVPKFFKEDVWLTYRLLLSLIVSKENMLMVLNFDNNQSILDDICKKYENDGYSVLLVSYMKNTNKYKLVIKTISETNVLCFTDIEELSRLFETFSIKRIISIGHNKTDKRQQDYLNTIIKRYKIELQKIIV